MVGTSSDDEVCREARRINARREITRSMIISIDPIVGLDDKFYTEHRDRYPYIRFHFFIS